MSITAYLTKAIFRPGVHRGETTTFNGQESCQLVLVRMSKCTNSQGKLFCQKTQGMTSSVQVGIRNSRPMISCQDNFVFIFVVHCF